MFIALSSRYQSVRSAFQMKNGARGACVMNGAGSYTCGGCKSDLDCCAPNFCDVASGVCFAP